ncbi:hypothetical protein [Mycoplasma buteonis]|uniref:hypothetical protein n=1 Tax=Mycoplasma buteonis TaxID=171280 RepID=UPI0012EC723A|nr:hypothetical protein [Mycoplasma buteonis]
MKKGKIQTEKFSYFLLLLPIYSFFYQKKISTKLTILTNDFLISLDDYDLNYYLSILKSEKIRGIFNKHFKISIMDVSLGSLLLALFIIATVLLKLTPLRFVSFNFEFLFAIVYAYLFRYVKGIFLAFLSDALGMVVTGTIGQWYWMYALSPIFIVIFSSLLFDLFQRNKKITLVISILMLIGSFVLLGALFFIKISQTEGNDFRISSIFNLKSLPIYVGYILFSVGLMITLLLVSLSIWLLFTKDSKRKQNLTRLIFLIALVVSVVVIVRWIWGPYAWINFSMYIGRMRSATYANDKDWYFGLMILIALKSFIAMPIYVFFLFFILSPLEFLKKRYFEQNLKLKY